MLRAQQKRLFVGGQLSDIFGGRHKVLQGAIMLQPPVTGMAAWYDASDATTLTLVSGLVSGWADKSGNGRDLSQATSTKRPAYGARTINGYVVPLFDGTDDNLTSSMPDDQNSWTAFAVALADDTGVGRALFGSNGGTGGNEFRRNAANRLETLRESTTSYFASSVALTVPGSAAFQVTQSLGPAGIAHYLNGSSESTAVVNNYTAGRTLMVGGSQNGEMWKGLLAEVIIYSTTLTSGDIAAMNAYLKAKWGTP